MADFVKVLRAGAALHPELPLVQEAFIRAAEQIEAMRDALELVPMFYEPGWTMADQESWRRITGKSEVTTKGLCDHIRKVLGNV